VINQGINNALQPNINFLKTKISIATYSKSHSPTTNQQSTQSHYQLKDLPQRSTPKAN
jgi:hypothetical protein